MPVLKKTNKPSLLAPPRRKDFGRLGGETGAEDLFRGTEPSFWKFWTHGVTASMMGVYFDCHEQMRLEYVEGWSPRSESFALAFGTCVHWILENFYADRSEYAKYPPDDDTIERMMDRYTEYWNATHPSPSQEQCRQLEEVCGYAENALPGYFDRFGGDFTGRYNYGYGHGVSRPVEWLCLEEVFEIPYTYPDGRTVPLRGRIDGVVVDEQGRVLIFDTKTKSIIDEAKIAKMLSADFQAMLYLTVAEEWYKAGKLPKRPSGAILNIFKRPLHRQKQKETLSEFHVRLRDEYKKPESFDDRFFRIQVTTTQADVQQWKRTRLDPAMDGIRGWWEGRYPHEIRDNHLEMRYGSVRMFQPITCGDFTNLYKREHVFPELPEVV